MNAFRSGKHFSLSDIFIFGCIIFAAILILTSSKNYTPKIQAARYVQTGNSTSMGKEASIMLPYFPKIYSGVGNAHMNINLVNLKLTGLKTGDEIGVFDGEYCVGAMVITEKHMLDNSMNIPSSANDSLITSPNGFIEGHRITLKAYRTGKVYLLYFQTVNNSEDIFESRGSMFAMVDFARSTGQSVLEDLEHLNIYPNPFTEVLHIEIKTHNKKNLTIAIFDLNGNLIKAIHDGKVEGVLQVIWDGKDMNEHPVPTGIYICRINQSSYRIINQRYKIQ
jgi:hypothetical protein